MGDRFNLSDMSEKLVTQPFSLACSGNETGNIDKFHRCWNDLFRLYNFT